MTLVAPVFPTETLVFALQELLLAGSVLCAVLWAVTGKKAAAPDPDESDEELMRRFAQGDSKAFNRLMSRYERRVYGFIYRSLYDKDKAPEIFQDSFYKVVRAKDRYDPEQRFSTWLFTIVRNTLIDYYKKKKLRVVSLSTPLRPGETKGTLEDRIPDTTSAEGGSYASERQLEVRLKEALKTLNPDQRDVFVLRQFDGRPFAEIAEIVGCPVNTAKTRMRYALEALRRELAEFA